MNEMRSYLFVVDNLNLGGVQKSLVSFANKLTLNNKVTICVLTGRGLLTEQLSREIIIIYPNSRVSKFVNIMSVHKDKLKSNRINYVRKGIYRLIQNIGLGYLLNRFIVLNNKIFDSYDVAISYTGLPGVWDEVVQHNINAKIKIAWIHNNPYSLKLDKINATKYYDRFDAIINVSKDCLEKFNNICPQLNKKNHLIYNIVDENEIITKAGIESPFVSKKFVIVTVSRIQNSSKRFDRIIQSAILLNQLGVTEFEWYIIGDGPESNWLKTEINLNKLDNVIHFIGFKENPYPYIKFANLFILASDYEGLPVTLMETRILSTPILVTNFDCANEALYDYKKSKIVEKDPKSLANGIIYMMSSNEDLWLYDTYTINNTFTNSVNNFEKLLGDLDAK